WSNVREMLQRLNDSRPAVKRRAVEVLRTKITPFTKAWFAEFDQNSDPEVRRNMMWCTVEVSTVKFLDLALKDKDESVRRVALHIAGLGRYKNMAKLPPSLLPLVAQQLSQGSPAIQRAAAEAIGRWGDKRPVPSLLRALGKNPDRALEHSLTYALIEIGD